MHTSWLISFCLMLSCVTAVLAQQPVITPAAAPTVAAAASAGDAAVYQYLFVNDRFTTKRLTVNFDAAGAGSYSFTRKDDEEIRNPLKVSPALLSQINALFAELNYLASGESYQHKKDFSHLGTITISVQHGGRTNQTKFNYTESKPLNQLADIFRGLATREMRVFEIENTRQTDPISTPAQMRLLDSELRGRHIADPPSLMPLLLDIKQDEGIPLIARNHAQRLIEFITKGK